MARTVYLDTESVKSSHDFPDGWGVDLYHWADNETKITSRNVLSMGFCAGCIYNDDGVTLYTDPVDLLSLLLSDDVSQIVTYNGEYFDFALLIASCSETPVYADPGGFTEEFKEIFNSLIGKSADAAYYVQKAVGRPVSLDSIRKVLTNPKAMSGVDFSKKFLSGDPVQVVEAINYLIADVLDLYKIYGCGVYNKQLVFVDAMGVKQRFDVEFPPLITAQQ